MLKNENSLSILNKSRNTSNNDKDDETDTNHKKETIITNTSKILSNNSKERSAIYKNIKGFAFSLGSRILKNNAHEHTLIRSLFKRKSSKNKIKSTVKKDKIPEEVLHCKTNSFQRKVSKEKLSSSSKLVQYYNARKGSVNSIKSVRSLFKEDESFKEVIDIYNKYDDKIEPKIIKKLKEVEKCSILKYGIKPSTEEISYSYCLTCDSSLINPICIPCLKKCHIDHVVKESYETGKIICSCGERSHILSNEGNVNLNTNISNCLCNEWGKVSNLNICYLNIAKDSPKEYLCLLCYNFCSMEKNNYSPIFYEMKEGEDFPKCSCSNKRVHNESRILLNLLDKLTLKYKKYDGFNLLHPTQIINILLRSKKSFEHNFNNFNEIYKSVKNNNFINSSIHYSLSKVDFYYTNCFVIMKCLLNLISFNNHNNISYYCEEVEKYFSLEIIHNLTENLKNCSLKESSIWVLSQKYLKLFRKVYIGNKTQFFDKYKIEDLDNFSSCQRFSLYYQIEKKFPHFQEIISFLIHYLRQINLKGFTTVEAISLLGEVMGIIKKLAYFNLVSNGDIIRTLQETGKLFINLNILRNFLKRSDKRGAALKVIITRNLTDLRSNTTSEINENTSSHHNKKDFSVNESENEIYQTEDKLIEVISFEEELPLYYTIIKMLRIFYLTFNDRLVHNILVDDVKYKNDDNFFNNNNISFGYMKNDFGREIFKVTIKMLYTIHKYNKITEKNYSLYKKILFHGRKLLEYALMKKDSYLISLLRTFINGEFYENKINLLLNINDNNNKNSTKNENTELNLLMQEKKNLEESNRKFLNFEISKEELIKNYGKSLDNILNDDKLQDKEIVGFNENKLILIIKTKYFFTLSKIYRILNYFNEIILDENIINKRISLMIYSSDKIAQEDKLINDLTPKIFLFYKNFIFNSSENSLLVISHYIFNDLTKIPISFGVDNFLLFHSCLENISRNNYIENILNSTQHYLNNLYDYLQYLYGKKYKKINECLLIFLKCFYLLTINIKSADYEILIKDIKTIIIEINGLFNIAKNYFKYNEEGVSEILRKIENDEKDNKYEMREFSEIENGLKVNNSNINTNKINKNNDKERLNLDTLEKCLIIDLQIINDFFDFTLTDQKELIVKLIDVNKVIYCLKFQNITHLALRTQLIRYARKILVDMNYNSESNFIYVNSIINNEDNLNILKISPLINNFKYPTKLLSYSKDFWNLSIKSKVNKNIVQSSTRLAEALLNVKNTENEEESESSSESPSSCSPNNSVKKKESLFKTSKLKEIKPDEEVTSRDIKTCKNSYISNNENIFQKEFVKCFDINVYDLLINELSNVNDILSEVNTSSLDEMQTLGEYFQNGLLIPIIFFFKKSFALAHNLTGSELVKLYDLVTQTINLKITISEFKYNFWDDKNNFRNNFEEDLFCTHMLNSRKGLLINGKNFIDGEIIKTSNNSLKILRSKNFTCFDYTLLYSIVEKNLFCLISEYSQNSIGELFSEKEEDINIQLLNKPFSTINNNHSNINEKLYKIYLLYKNNKNIITEEENSSFFNILPEICIEYETNYRNLIIFTLVAISIKPNLNNSNEDNFNDSVMLYFIIYKLLSLQTFKTQTEIMNLLGGTSNETENLGFMLTYSQNLLKRIILIFIDEFNPRDRYFNDNYILAVNLIKIFKFLCEEHNNFFQMRLIKVLNYQYKNIIPMFYKENKNFKEYQNQYANSVIYNFGLNLNVSEEKEKVKNIKFFDFYLYVLLKISLISGWNEIKDLHKPNTLNKHLDIYSPDENENIYDLFSSIIEMLNEIIQGNKEQNLNRLGNPFFKDEENLSSDEDDDYKDIISLELDLFNGGKNEEDKKIDEKYNLKKRLYEKLRIQKDPFTCFLRGMIEFIFIDSSNSQILYQLRNDLMLFFTSILEEKNCNEEVQKLIMKYLNIHRVFGSISEILKNYFLANVPPDSLPADFFPSKVQKNTNSQSLSFDYYLSKKESTIDVNKLDNNNQDNKSNNLNNHILREKLIFDHRLLNYYYNHYYSNKDFFISNEFQLANAFYKYIKLIAVLGKSEEIKTIIEEAESIQIATAIKKFAPNLVDIKKEETKGFNSKNINNQIRLSKSLRNLKTLKTLRPGNMRNKPNNSNNSEQNNLITKTDKNTNEQTSKNSKKTNNFFLSTIYSKKNLIKKIPRPPKNPGLTPKNTYNKNNNFFKIKNFDNSDSSRRVLGTDKKDNESTVKNLENTNNKSIENNSSHQNKENKESKESKENKIINKNNSRNKNKSRNKNNDKKNENSNEISNDTQKKNENNEMFMNLSEKINFNTNADKVNYNISMQNAMNNPGQKRRFSVFFKIKERKGEKYPLIPNNSNEIYDKEYIERFYIVKFFESITSTVEVRNEDCLNQTVIFTHIPEMIYLSNGTKAEFEKNVNRTSETCKKNDLIRHLGYFQKEIEYYKNNFSALSHWVSKIDFYYVKCASYLFALLINILALFTIYGDTRLTVTNDNSYDILKVRRNDKTGIQQRIDYSIDNWHKMYQILNIIYMLLNGILIFVWIYFRLPLYYELDKIKFFEENIHKKSLNFWDKLYIIIFMTIWNRNYISSIVYEFIISIICFILKKGEVIFPFLLLAIVDLNITLKNVILSIKHRHKEFTRAFFLAFIFMYAMSNLAFFFFNKDYIQELDYHDDNVCKTLIFCVLNALDNGLRARGGIGDSGIRISFMRDKSHYIQRLIMDDIFFLLVVIIAIDLVFGVIIGEFDALRGEEQKHEADRLYHCFICHVNKNTLEKNRQNFYLHVNKDHNMWNYVSYMIFVKLSNIHDLNSINSYARDKIDNKDISWLPSYKDLINSDNENNKEDETEEDEDFKIEEENINNHYIVQPT